MEQQREGQNSKEKLKGENGKKKEKKEWERANVLGHSQIMALQQIITHISAQNDSMIEEVDSGPRNHRAKPRRRKQKAQARVGEKGKAIKYKNTAKTRQASESNWQSLETKRKKIGGPIMTPPFTSPKAKQMPSLEMDDGEDK